MFLYQANQACFTPAEAIVMYRQACSVNVGGVYTLLGMFRSAVVPIATNTDTVGT